MLRRCERRGCGGLVLHEWRRAELVGEAVPLAHDRACDRVAGTRADGVKSTIPDLQGRDVAVGDEVRLPRHTIALKTQNCRRRRRIDDALHVALQKLRCLFQRHHNRAHQALWRHGWREQLSEDRDATHKLPVDHGQAGAHCLLHMSPGTARPDLVNEGNADFVLGRYLPQNASVRSNCPHLVAGQF